MAIYKKEYELSIWKEELTGEGQKTETKLYTIGADDMDYLGGATNKKLNKKSNGTQTLTFQMPDNFFDSERGEYVRNEFIDELFAERKIKLKYDSEWYEFFIKKVSETKNFKSYMKTYECQDAFIDELSRNGYGITFDEELYNNVEEIGVFSETILEDSIWEYHPEHNWGDFTEYLAEKLFKIPIECFGGTIQGYKFDFTIGDKSKQIINAYTNENRNAEMGDDLARDFFWDQKDNDNLRLNKNLVSQIPNDGYIYVPYSCLDFCYTNYSGDPNVNEITYDRAATETAASYPDKNSYAIAPSSVDPRTIIQFLAIPEGEQIEVDEAGLIVSKEYSYFMTLRQWNEQVQNNYWYFFKDTRLINTIVEGTGESDNIALSHTLKYLLNKTNVLDTTFESIGNKAVYYDGYLSDINDLSEIKGKKISVTDRTELNITEEINQYVNVYNNKATNYKSLYTNKDWDENEVTDNYRVCSKIATRQIVPQLARNFAQNGTNIQSTDGWAIMKNIDDIEIESAALDLRFEKQTEDDDGNILLTPVVLNSYLYYRPCRKAIGYLWRAIKENGDIYSLNICSIGNTFYSYIISNNIPILTKISDNRQDAVNKLNIKKLEAITDSNNKQKVLYAYATNDANNTSTKTIKWTIEGKQNSYTPSNEENTFLNFGLVGQDKKIEKGKIYCFGTTMNSTNNGTIWIGEGNLIANETYAINKNKAISLAFAEGKTQESIQFSKIVSEQIWNNYHLENEDGLLNVGKDFSKTLITQFIFFKVSETINNPYIAIETDGELILKDLFLFEAYTKGQDQFVNGKYKYSGRDLLFNSDTHWLSREIEDGITVYFINAQNPREEIIFEDDIMLGDTYEYQQYFIQRLLCNNKGYDTMGQKEFISTSFTNEASLPLDASIYTEDDYEIQINYIDMNQCEYFINTTTTNACDCKYNSTNNKATKTCIYQKYGYCPYRFTTEKHCRKIRTLKGEKSNRFNLLQELSKVFQVYPIFYIQHNEDGSIKYDNNKMDKEVFFITEKGKENKIGFRYEKNLQNISRTINSDKIVSKLYVQDVDSDLSATGLCSIKTAEDNPSKDSFIIDFSYYIAKGTLSAESVERDLYGISANSNENFQGYLKQLGYYNTQYDLYANKIINLQNASFTELEANLIVNLEGIETSLQQLRKYRESLEKFKRLPKANSENENSSYKNYLVKYAEQEAILAQLINDTFFTNGIYDKEADYSIVCQAGITIDLTENYQPIQWLNLLNTSKIKENWVDTHSYFKGILGQFNREYLQIQEWKKEQARYLKLINALSLSFFRKYEPYLKEGTWTDSNYLTDNAYYHGALEVAAEGAIPKVSYNINTIDLYSLPEYEDYHFDIADTTYIEDIGMFGINQKTGLPNKLKVLISQITYDLDQPKNNQIQVQNFTTQFEDLFQQVSASVQSLTYNENIYKRSSNFTSLKNIEKNSLQGTLNTNDLTLINTQENNITIDNTGQSGSDINNHANKYKLNGQGLFFSNNGGESWNVGVGPSGINADYIKVGTLDAGKIRIADSGYIYFAWDKSGLNAYRDPTSPTYTSNNSNDYISFNKYGLSLIQNGKIRLRSGYSFTGEDGNIFSEGAMGEDIGFYLYDYNGNEILRTEIDSDNNINRSARLSLLGEMFISDGNLGGKVNSSDSSTYTYSNLINNNTINRYNVYTMIEQNTTPNDLTQSGNANFVGLIGNNYYAPINIAIYRNSNEIYYKIGTKFYIQGAYKQDCYTYSSLSSATSSITVSLNVSSQNIYYTGTNPMTLHTRYIVNGQSYMEKTSETIQTAGSDNKQLGIFLNNLNITRQLNISDDELYKNYRVLSAITKEENSTYRNIFTILRNGVLAMGGTVSSDKNSTIVSLNEMPDIIEIKNPGIAITDKGYIYSDFNKMLNINGESLISYVSQNITGAINNLSLSLGNNNEFIMNARDEFLNSSSEEDISDETIKNHIKVLRGVIWHLLQDTFYLN